MVYAGLFVAVAAGNAGGIQGFDVQPQGLGMCVFAPHHNTPILPTSIPLARLPARNNMLPDPVSDPRQLISCLAMLLAVVQLRHRTLQLASDMRHVLAGRFGVSSPSNVQAVLSIAASENTIGFTYQFVVDPGAVTVRAVALCP